MEAYERIRQPHGNKNIHNARGALREFQFNGNCDDMKSVVENITHYFSETFATTGPTPDTDVQRALNWMVSQIPQEDRGGKA